MKILMIADRKPAQSILKTLSEHPDIELIVTLGDLSYFDIQELGKVSLPKIGVYGNHCNRGYMEQFGILDLHTKTYEFKGYLFGGFEGSLKYKTTDAPMFMHGEANAEIKKLPKVDILISHSPGYGIHDKPGDHVHEGFHALRSYLDQHQPLYNFHGHTDPKEPLSKYNQTWVQWIFQDQIVVIPNRV